MNEKFQEARSEAERIMDNFEFIEWPASVCQVCVFVNKPRTKILLYLHMQSKFTALHGSIYDFANLNQELEKMKFF